MRYWLSIWPWGFYDTVILKASNDRITDELERTNKEVILDKFMHYPCVCHGLRKYMGRYSWWHDQDSNAKYDKQNSFLHGCTSLLGCSHAKQQKESRVFSYTHCITKGKEHVPVCRCALLQGCWTTARTILQFFSPPEFFTSIDEAVKCSLNYQVGSILDIYPNTFLLVFLSNPK